LQNRYKIECEIGQGGYSIVYPNRKLYLIDFGIARAFKPSKAKDTTPLGSPGYAAPEQYGRAQSDQRRGFFSHRLPVAFLESNSIVLFHCDL
jgi:serine/threonine protein kinase